MATAFLETPTSAPECEESEGSGILLVHSRERHWGRRHRDRRRQRRARRCRSGRHSAWRGTATGAGHGVRGEAGASGTGVRGIGGNGGSRHGTSERHGCGRHGHRSGPRRARRGRSRRQWRIRNERGWLGRSVRRRRQGHAVPDARPDVRASTHSGLRRSWRVWAAHHELPEQRLRQIALGMPTPVGMDGGQYNPMMRVILVFEGGAIAPARAGPETG